MAKYVPGWPVRILEKDSNDPLQHNLWNLQATYHGVVDRREKFQRAVAAVRQRGVDGELGPVGVNRELKRLEGEFVKEVGETLAPMVARVRARTDELHAKLTKRQVKESANADEAVRNAFAEHRAIGRFEALPRDQRRAAVRVALEKKDFAFLSVIYAEPALLDEVTARIVGLELMRNADPAAFNELQTLTGAVNPTTGEHDPLNPLVVASFMIDNAAEFARELTGTTPTAKERLTEAGIKVDGSRIVLSDEQAKDVAIFRSARDVAAAEGKEVEIVGPDGLGSYEPGSNGAA